MTGKIKQIKMKSSRGPASILEKMKNLETLYP
jgi:hypothetical protein